MKNKAVEALARVQFNISDDVDVNVEFLASSENGYEFELVWFDIDIRYQSNITLPSIDYTSQDMLDQMAEGG